MHIMTTALIQSGSRELMHFSTHMLEQYVL